MSKTNFNLKVGGRVAFNLLDDATWFDIIEIDGFQLTLRETGMPNGKLQYIDKSLVKQFINP
jgi:hypothetical protein